jgi:pimeloyl-ACP methyl ester carboxylesterase
MSKRLFLPGAGGSPEFWQPVSKRLPTDWEKVLFGWPGLGDQPHDPSLCGIDDLVRLVEAQIDQPVDLIAQSMGGVIAARIAIARPDRVRRLVLVATSGGVDMERFRAADWRAAYRAQFPRAARWITEKPAATEICVERISAPTLLLWGDADDISPPDVGCHLRDRIPNATLHILPGSDHDLALNRAEEVAGYIAGHLM